ncbi:type II toxin-antitoxin system Phd/YefM family antitoxin [uncultured Sphingomonas sp.]|uniref:type II toxin-antitoxin system Phd/YefM family antitoxin n=1 Tax=uncultured Sphingomonas sp. TaxID=158754 RepID=UPI0035CB9BE8
MDRPITSTQASDHFGDVLRDVENGDTFVVTSAGEPVAKIIPVFKSRKQQQHGMLELLDYLEALPTRDSGE